MAGRSVVAVAAGEFHTVMCTDVGQVFTCGYGGGVGALGHGDTNTQNMPKQVANIEGVTSIAAGSDHSLADVGDEGRLYAWG